MFYFNQPKCGIFTAGTILAVLFCIHAAHAAIITVNTDTSGSGCTIIDAIDSANADSATGGCALTTTGAFGDDTIILPPDQNIHTLFAINNTSPFGPSGLPVIHSKIIIEGNGGFIKRLNTAGAPVYRLFYVSTNGNLTLRNLTLQYGLSEDGNNTISDMYKDAGSAILNYGGALTLDNCTIKNNASGALSLQPTVQNISVGTFPVNVTVKKTRIISNNGQGIGIHSAGAITGTPSLVVQDSIISLNTVRGIGISEGSVRVDRTEISLNERGGIFVLNDAILQVRDSTISANTSIDSGGGIGIFGLGNPQVTLINDTISGNTASAGGGISHTAGTLNLVNTLVSGNQTILASGLGKEIYRKGAISGTQLNNLFGDNSNTSAQALSGFATKASDITATSDGAIPTALTRIILPLKQNGSARKTHAVPAGSPALNAAVSTYSTGVLPFLSEGCAYTSYVYPYHIVYRNDQRGVLRPQQGQCDIGAFEAEGTSFYVIPVPGGKTVIFGL